MHVNSSCNRSLAHLPTVNIPNTNGPIALGLADGGDISLNCSVPVAADRSYVKFRQLVGRPVMLWAPALLGMNSFNITKDTTGHGDVYLSLWDARRQELPVNRRSPGHFDSGRSGDGGTL